MWYLFPLILLALRSAREIDPTWRGATIAVISACLLVAVVAHAKSVLHAMDATQRAEALGVPAEARQISDGIADCSLRTWIIATLASPVLWFAFRDGGTSALLLVGLLWLLWWLLDSSDQIAIDLRRLARRPELSEEPIALHPDTIALAVNTRRVLRLWLYWPWLALAANVALVSPDIVRFFGYTSGLPEDAESVHVTLHPGDDVAEIEPFAAALGLKIERLSDNGRLHRVRGPRPLLTALTWYLRLDVENVRRVQGYARALAEPYVEAGPCQSPTSRWALSDPFAAAQPYLNETGVFALHDEIANRRHATPALLAVLDHGVWKDEDLPHVSVLEAHPPKIRAAHGVQVAAAAAAVSHNAIGVSSANLMGRHVRILSIPVLDEDYVDPHEVALAVRLAVAGGAKVINLSLGGDGPASPELEVTIEWAIKSGVLVVAAAGNDGGFAGAADQWPSNVPGVLVVGGLSAHGHRSTRSNHTRGVAFAVSAPAEGICVPHAVSGYTTASGTSFATAQVSGGAATLRSLCPGASAAEVRATLVQTADPVADPNIGSKVRFDRAFDVLRRRHLCP